MLLAADKCLGLAVSPVFNAVSDRLFDRFAIQ
jgi:hypothetical protein